MQSNAISPETELFFLKTRFFLPQSCRIDRVDNEGSNE